MDLHVEIHPLLNSANIYLFNCNANNIQLSLHPSEICFYNSDSQKSTRVKLDQVQFQPDTCCNLQQVSSGGICFRVQIKSSTNSTESNNFIRPLEPCNAKCVFCDSILIYENSTFQRVLPLPSNETLNEFTSWFCCQHSAPPTPLLNPKQQDLLHSDQCLLVNSEVVDLGAITVDGKNSVRCKRCHSLVGKTIASPTALPAFKFYKYAVVMNSSSNNEERKSCVVHYKNVFVSILLNFYKEGSNKIIITSETTKKFAILIWLTNVGMLRFSTSITPEDQRDICLSPNGALKVLYLIVDTKSNDYNDWQRDIAVESMHVSDEFQLNIANILVQSTKDLPNLLKKLDKFWISFL